MTSLDPYTRVFQPGETVVAEDSFDQRLLILKSGTLDVMKGDRIINVVDQPGALLGEMSYLTQGRRTAKLRARTRCELHVLDKSLDVVIRRFPSIAEKIMAALVDRVLASENAALELHDMNARLRLQIERMKPAKDSGAASEGVGNAG